MSARILFALLALALIGGGGYLLGKTFISSGATKLPPVSTAPVVTQNIEQTITFIGEVERSLFTDLKSEVSGRVEAVHVVPGDLVNEGEVLIELDRSELTTQFQEASLDIEASRLSLEKITLDHDSKRDLHAKGFVSEREFEDARIDRALAENQLAIQKSRLQLIQDKLDKTTIRAPHGGVVLGDELTPGMVITGASSVSNGDVLMQIAQLNELLVKTAISEVDIDNVHRDMPVELAFDSLPGVLLSGRILFVSPSARPKDKPVVGAVPSSSARVFPITVGFSASENARVRPGMTAQVTVVLGSVENALAATLPALFLEEGESVVYVKNGDAFDRRVVDIGINDHDVVEIKSGLEEGDQLATSRPEGFEDPTPARVQSSSRSRRI